MKTYKLILMVFCAIGIAQANALPQNQDILKKLDLKSQIATKNFTGQVSHQSYFSQKEGAELSVSIVNFDRGARTYWHDHPKGQILIVTSGTGITQTKDGQIYLMHEGDRVYCPSGITHFHGATSDSKMSHIAITPFYKGSNVNWYQEVSNIEYQKALSEVKE